MYVTLKDRASGKARNLKVGFSWFFLLATPFYGIPQFVNGIWKHGLAVALIGVFAVATMGSPATPFIGLILIAAAVFYGIKGNQIVAKSLLAEGWEFDCDEHSVNQARIRWGLSA